MTWPPCGGCWPHWPGNSWLPSEKHRPRSGNDGVRRSLAPGAFTTRLCGATAVVYARITSRDALYDRLSGWVADGCDGPGVPTYPVFSQRLPVAAGAELRDIDEAPDLELARGIFPPDVRLGPSDAQATGRRPPAGGLPPVALRASGRRICCPTTSAALRTSRC